MISGFTSSTRSRFSTMLYVRWNALLRGSAWPWVRKPRTLERFSYDLVSVSVRSLFHQPMDEKIKTWPLRFPAKETLIWRRHCSAWQYDVKEISRKFFGHEVCLPARSLSQPKPRSVCIRFIHQSNRSISVRLLFLFCSRVFISRSYENRSNERNFISPFSIYVVVNFLSSQVIFVFVLFLSMVMYANEGEKKEKYILPKIKKITTTFTLLLQSHFIFATV